MTKETEERMNQLEVAAADAAIAVKKAEIAVLNKKTKEAQRLNVVSPDVVAANAAIAALEKETQDKFAALERGELTAE